jgi:hypothetical protein
MINATSVDSIPRLSFRKRNANHLLPLYEVLRTELVNKLKIEITLITNSSHFSQEAGEIWIENEQQSSTKN